MAPHGICTTANGVVFADRKRRQIMLVDSNGRLSILSGSGRQGGLNGASRESEFHQPTAVCSDGRSVFVCDRLGKTVRLVSPTSGLADFLSPLNKLLKVFGDHAVGAKAETHSLADAQAFVESYHSKLVAWTAAANIARGCQADAHAEGPEGCVPSRTIGSVLLLGQAVKSVAGVIQSINPSFAAHLRMSAFRSVPAENQFARMRGRNPMPTKLEYMHLRSSAIKENAKLLAPLPYTMPSPVGFHYSQSDGFLPFERLRWPEKMKSAVLSEDDERLMREFASYARGVRQRTPRSERSMDKTGTLPQYVWLQPEIAPLELDLDGHSLDSMFSAQSWFAIEISAVPHNVLPAGVIDFLLGRCRKATSEDAKAIAFDIFAADIAAPLEFFFVQSHDVRKSAVLAAIGLDAVSPNGCPHGSECQLSLDACDFVRDKLKFTGDSDESDEDPTERKGKPKASKSKAQSKAKPKQSESTGSDSRSSTRSAASAASLRIAEGAELEAAMPGQDPLPHGLKRGDIVAVRIDAKSAEHVGRPFSIGKCGTVKDGVVDVELYAPKSKNDLRGSWKPLTRKSGTKQVPELLESPIQAVCLVHLEFNKDGKFSKSSLAALIEEFPDCFGIS
jgi:hypothetical protein